jgi:hypothetical protein
MPRIIYIIGAAGLILILVLVFFFGLGGNNPTSPAKRINLQDYADSNAVVSFTTDGIINGDDIHRAIRINISSTNRELVIYQGYQSNVLSTTSFSNNSSAYKQFLAALQTAGWLTQVKRPATTDINGKCPLGNRYIYNNQNIDSAPDNLWTTTCSGIKGTFAGNISLVNQLFRNQITGYSNLVSGVSLSGR